ncbi:MAG: prepilin-type N-terminal cleavage/methylation domain-containing protein [Nitrospinae bacterium]|nr:prepilin-type N-terminal cleavage/methylation domain-containing protein [Nitrospinota bacterium]MBF0634808.1 prepilin-type N-terminal cleavage/methylation domain-containing protein [Nitrospinota bacterium]
MSRFNKVAERGFSIIELTAVIALISILAITATPSFLSQDEAALVTAAQTLANDLRITRMNAVWGGSPRSVIITPGTGVYLYDSANGVGKTRDLGEIRRGITLQTQSAISFNSMGESGPNTDAIALSLNGLSRTVTIAPFTARIYVR